MASDSSSFSQYQQRRRTELRSLLGEVPVERPATARILSVEHRPGCTVEHLELDLNGIEPVPALLLLPDRRSARAAGLLYLHAHGGTYGLGKEELFLGRKCLSPLAPVCIEQGLVTLAIDSWCFSSRQHEEDGRLGEHNLFKDMLWHGRTLWGMMLFDELQALSYLAGRPEVDPERLGAFGLSMGATKAWWLAALDTRIRLCIDLCCLTDYQELLRTRHLEGHGFYYYIPDLLRHFQAHQINELIVPRPRLSLNGRFDPLTPPVGVERIRDHLMPLYARHGHPDDCHIELFECGHEETPTMRDRTGPWLRRHLAGPG